MTNTTSGDLAAALRFTVQKKVLENLRANLFYADPRFAEEGRFDAGSDMLTFIGVPDITLTTTPLTEGTAPTAAALSITTVMCSTAQYGSLVGITDLAKVKSPIEIATIGAERLARQAQESLDQVARDVIALSGTVVYAEAKTTRVGLTAAGLTTISELRKLNYKMKKAKIPPMADGYYLFMAHPNVIYDIKLDTTVGGWTTANLYADATRLFTGEVGKLEGFRVVEVVNAPTWASTVTVYGSIAIGGVKPWGMGELQTLQTYHVPLGGDHTDPLGQVEYLGWKVNWGVAALSNGYYARYESAATVIA
jgi:N4-gp56 family major capsid protein